MIGNLFIKIKSIIFYRNCFKCEVGLSDHSGSPYPSIYALSNGYLDNVSLERIQTFEKEIQLGLKNDSAGQKIYQTLMETKTLPKEADLKAFIDARKKVI